VEEEMMIWVVAAHLLKEVVVVLVWVRMVQATVLPRLEQRQQQELLREVEDFP
jgi:hypothetical protein